MIKKTERENFRQLNINKQEDFVYDLVYNNDMNNFALYLKELRYFREHLIYNCLRVAINKCHLEMSQYLIENYEYQLQDRFLEIDPKNVINSLGSSDNLLVLGVKTNNKDLIDYLLKAAKKTNAIQETYSSCLIHASSLDNEELVKQLLSLGAEVQYSDQECLRQAILNGNINIAKILVKHGGDIHAEDEMGLWNALYSQKLDMIHLIENLGSDHTKLHNGVLIDVAENDNYIAVQYLLEKGLRIKEKGYLEDNMFNFITQWINKSELAKSLEHVLDDEKKSKVTKRKL